MRNNRSKLLRLSSEKGHRLKLLWRRLTVKFPFTEHYTHKSRSIPTSGPPTLIAVPLQQPGFLTRPKPDDHPSTTLNAFLTSANEKKISVLIEREDLPNLGKTEKILQLEDVSVVEIDGSDKDEDKKQTNSSQEVKEKVNPRVWIKTASDIAGSQAKSYGAKIDTGADQNVVAEDIAIRIHLGLGIPIYHYRDQENFENFRVGNGQLVESEHYIEVPWMLKSVGLDPKQPWPESKFYIIRGTSMELGYDFLISTIGISEIKDRGGSLGL
ncbi:hypothetical protein H2200_008858 [Cladophialophora chaetospira]|uniref:Uncharacterized protein n=1 Tax=Cladophialophora chaetospira TaxID=386627 RepID=A0AA39CFP3_9EURO|nr:hypothetical protein H2200_008858 [Cladophialophora chaetospira]